MHRSFTSLPWMTVQTLRSVLLSWLQVWMCRTQRENALNVLKLSSRESFWLGATSSQEIRGTAHMTASPPTFPPIGSLIMVCAHSGRQPTDGPGGPPADRAHSAWLLSPHTSTLLLLFPPRLVKDLCLSSFLHFSSQIIWLETHQMLHPALISVHAWRFFLLFCQQRNGEMKMVKL